MISIKSGRIPAFQAALDDSKRVIDSINALTRELENHRLGLQNGAQTVEVETHQTRRDSAGTSPGVDSIG